MKKIIALLLITTLNPCFAINDVEKISLRQAIDTALKTNPQIKMSVLDINISKNNIKIADRLQNPSFGTFQNIGTSGKGNPQQVGADLTLEILKRGKRKATAQSTSIIAYDNEKYEEQNLILAVKKTYIDFLLKKSNLKILTEQKELTKELLNSAAKASCSQTDVIQAKIAYNRAIMAANTAKSEVIFSQNRFNAIMNTSTLDYDTQEEGLNDDYENLLTVNPLNKTITFEQIRNYALTHRYDLLKTREEVELAKNNLKEVKSKLIPDIELSGGYAYQPKSSSGINSFQSGAYAAIGIVNIPLFYRYEPEIKNAQIEIEKAELKFQDMQIDIIRDITDAWEKFVIARDNLNFYNKELLQNSKELLAASKKNYKDGEMDITSFLVSKKFYLELMLDYHEALAQYYTSYAELLKEMNANDIKEIADL